MVFGLNGKYLHVNRLHVTSKKSVSIRSVSIVIETPSFMIIEIIFFQTVANPSSLYRSKFSFPYNGDNCPSR